MNQNQQKIIQNLQEAFALLNPTLQLLRAENEAGFQFDYVNSPQLTNAFDGVEKAVGLMDRIIYQR